MRHPFVTRALNKGAQIVYTDVGTDDDIDAARYWYDASLHQEYGPVLKSMAPCLLHCDNRYDTMGSAVSKVSENTGMGDDGRGATNIIWSSPPEEGVNPQQGPDYFEKRGCMKLNNSSIFRETAKQEQLLGGTNAHNPVGLTEFTDKSFIVWFKHDDVTAFQSTGDRGFIFSVEDEGAGSGSRISLSLEASSGRPIWSIGGTDFEEPCGADDASTVFNGNWCDNNWHMCVLTISGASRVRTYRRGKSTSNTSHSLPTFPTAPEYHAFFNRTKDSTTAGFEDWQLGPVSVVNRELTQDEVNHLWNAMWRTSDTSLPNGGVIETFSQAPEQHLRRSDLAQMSRIKGDDSWGYSNSTRNVDQISYGNRFRHQNQDSTGFSLFCMQQLAGEVISTDVVSMKYFDTITAQYSQNHGCCHQTSLGDLFQRQETGIIVGRTRAKATVKAFGDDTWDGPGEEYNFSSSAGFMDIGNAATGALGKYTKFAVTIDPTEVRFMTGTLDDDVDTTITPSANKLPDHDGPQDTPHPPQGIGLDERFTGGNQDDDYSVYGPMAIFGKKLTVTEVNELERIALGQAPLRSRRPTRGLLRQAALMAPGRILE